MAPHYIYEKRVLERMAGPVAGIDEAGRGPLAGPVVAAAVIFPERKRMPKGLNDSKQMPAEAREEAYEAIMESGAIVGVGEASVDEIDLINIRQATHHGDGARGARPFGGGHVRAGRRQRCAGTPLPLRHPHRWRRALHFDRRGLDRRQGHARPHDGRVAPRNSPATAGSPTRAIRPKSTSPP